MNINITSDEDQKEEAIETKRFTRQFTLVDVLSLDVNENDEPSEFPAFWEAMIKNSKLCQAPEINISSVINAVNSINDVVQSHKEKSFEYEKGVIQDQLEIRNILTEFQLNNAKTKPQYANVVDGFAFKDGKGAGRLTVEICEPIKSPIVNYGALPEGEAG